MIDGGSPCNESRTWREHRATRARRRSRRSRRKQPLHFLCLPFLAFLAGGEGALEADEASGAVSLMMRSTVRPKLGTGGKTALVSHGLAQCVARQAVQRRRRSVDAEKLASFLDQVYLGCTNRRECKPDTTILDEYRNRCPSAEQFGDLITADHKILYEECGSRNSHRFAVTVQDLATRQLQAHPCKTKTSQETEKSLQKYLEPKVSPKVIYTHNFLEFGKSWEDLSWNHCASTPHRSETNGIAERAIRRIKEGTFAVLLQSGLDEKWWADSMECYCYLRNIRDLLWDWKTPDERRFGKPFRTQVISWDDGRIPSDFLVERSFQVSLLDMRCMRPLVADVDGLENLDASEIHAQGLNANEVLMPRTEKIFFPFDRWVSQVGRKRSGVPNIHLNSGSSCTKCGAQRSSSRRNGRVSTIRPTNVWH